MTLSEFYQSLFGCTVIPPERDYSGADLDAGTHLMGARLTGVHLRLPGYGDSGPTLEIYSYSELLRVEVSAVNRPGYGHIAFEVESAREAQSQILGAGGRVIGDVTLTTSSGGRVTWCYVTDPEGNIIELQSWQ
jgi:catechol 2,3-dioxygenase-like lactoylglutathione lyase family enzyme